MKARLYLPTSEWLEVDLNKNYQILPNFQLWEISNTSATETVKLVVDERAWKLLKMLQLTRDKFGIMQINSVYRTATFNAQVGGDPKSCHLKCWAFDWGKANQTNSDRKEISEWWRALCREFDEIGAINYYSNGYHLEIGSDIQYGNTDFVIRDYRGKKGDW